MKLKLAQMWDHNGTNMEAIAFMYRDYKTLIALDENQDMTGQQSTHLHGCICLCIDKPAAAGPTLSALLALPHTLLFSGCVPRPASGPEHVVACLGLATQQS